MTKRIILSVITLLVVVCIGLSLISVVSLVLLARSDRAAVSPTLPPAGPVLATATQASLALTPTPPQDATLQATLPPSGDEPSAEVAQQMDEIQQQVISLRGLQPNAPVQRHLMSSEQLRQRVIDDFFKDYTTADAEDDSRILGIFGLLEPGFDLYNLYLDLYSEQIAGFYDSKTKEMYVIQGQGFQGPERMTYAHEFTHILQDQNYDLRDGLHLNEDYCETATEYCAAVTALIEGDASLSEQFWYFQFSTETDQQQVQEFYQNYQSPVYDSAPDFLQKDFVFPYLQGLEFVQSLYDRGGWPAIDRVYTKLPQSTEQILHPDQYPADSPVAVELPDLSGLLGTVWRSLDDNTLGEWYLYLVLAYGRDSSTRLPDSLARQAAAGWEGDHYRVYWNDAGQQALLFQRNLWELSSDIDEIWQAFEQYGQARWGQPTSRTANRLDWQSTPDGAVTFRRNGLQTEWLIAPDTQLLEQILAQM